MWSLTQFSKKKSYGLVSNNLFEYGETGVDFSYVLKQQNDPISANESQTTPNGGLWCALTVYR